MCLELNCFSIYHVLSELKPGHSCKQVLEWVFCKNSLRIPMSHLCHLTVFSKPEGICLFCLLSLTWSVSCKQGPLLPLTSHFSPVNMMWKYSQPMLHQPNPISNPRMVSYPPNSGADSRNIKMLKLKFRDYLIQPHTLTVRQLRPERL